MKATSTRVIFRTCAISLLILALVPAADAANITKSFELGPGTPNPSSHMRTYEIPSGLEVAAVVKYRRLGSGKEGIPITIELREPDSAPGVEGPIVESRSASATTTEKSVTIRSLASNRGCGKPWRIRVRYAGDGIMSAAVFGTARIDWDGTTRRINAETPGYVNRGTEKEVKIGDLNGFNEGAIGVSANWNHMIGPVPGPSPVKFRVFLIWYPHNDPTNQNIMQSQEAYSTNEANATPRLGYIVRVRQQSRGQWTLIFSNKDNHDAFVQTPVVNFSPTCT